ncbi:xanthine dehydrogenase large subunit [Pseudomonas citronellolis]|uniref:xanthine dehydrogenase molybdopterin binding subunit n=1 Tax=Pseudomonas citronellolis TaxID=53408 RepID=UPI0020A02FD6|nr:xanthine dehydrogenase molybdopterin binding subunit [Pseudomonas citronellolis]MCP1641129.1 xanthine dehydrogenase large subunit [Pseudomonas citronellolis]MCP1664047.1 xanthine dehydrogenase large subunit [Pseudomonas citronellolis]MCP1695022.1 xanthine dehydrogenase large subunit [Pseudomonas citronellolis]MCP1701882.1 xanthine dehydrogenase large subunit [Pseudomonas citronellolis]MCP1795768.1 xanthine dehydrogenase large subunit [Pseudomonas citronellolis]
MRSLPPLAANGGASETRSAGQARPHDSAELHVSGAARYVDDIKEPRELLHAAVGLTDIACGVIHKLDLEAVRNAPGVVAVLTLDDVPGHTDIGPVFPGDPLLAGERVKYHGQALFAVAAQTQLQARRAVRLAKVGYAEEQPLLDPLQAKAEERFVRPPHFMRRGDAEHGLAAAPYVLQASQFVGGQEHFYLEGQVSMAQPTDDGGMFVFTSSQHPSEVQKLVAEVLAIPLAKVTVEVRRMGGGFGGKETQAAPWACLAALLARKTGCAVKLRLPRADDMRATGKRHPFHNRYRVGFDAEGRLLAAQLEVVGDCGHSPDLSDAIVDRAMFHADNAYFIPDVAVAGYRSFTNIVSHTAFRGFGGPQGMMLIERAMDDIARAVGQDPLDVRKLNLYGGSGRDLTPYHQRVEHNLLGELIERLEASSDYRARRAAIAAYNAGSPVLKCGLALTPVKFGISFTAQHLNQAGALIHLYTDGSIQLNHGGTEMGQGLNTKVAQIVAEEFQVPLERVSITATRTDKVPNTSPTAASSGTDLNGMAARDAARTLKARLAEFLAAREGVTPQEVRFAHGQVQVRDKALDFAEVVQAAYFARVQLSATGFYRTPKIHYDRETGQGHPFFYFAYGAAVSEVEVDSLTGEYRLLRVDILHDVGRSLNPAIDIGQIEGGFVQGMGWLTSEELKWDAKGRLLTTGPATYKIPAVSDVPEDFSVALFDRPNEEDSVYLSKAVGEPPFMLAISVWSALRDAIASLADYRVSPALDTPATPERVLWACEALKGWAVDSSLEDAACPHPSPLPEGEGTVLSGAQQRSQPETVDKSPAPLLSRHTEAAPSPFRERAGEREPNSPPAQKHPTNTSNPPQEPTP